MIYDFPTTILRNTKIYDGKIVYANNYKHKQI